MPSRSDYLELYSDLGGYMTDNFGEAYEQYYGTSQGSAVDYSTIGAAPSLEASREKVSPELLPWQERVGLSTLRQADTFTKLSTGLSAAKGISLAGKTLGLGKASALLAPITAKAFGSSVGKSIFAGKEFFTQPLTKSALAGGTMGPQTLQATKGLTTTGSAAVGAGVALLGTGIKAIGDDDDDTTLNAGETIGGLMQGAGTGAAVAGLLGATGPVGWIAGGAIALISALSKRETARKKAEKQQETDIKIEGIDEYRKSVGEYQDKLAAERQARYYGQQAAMYDNAYGTGAMTPGGYGIYSEASFEKGGKKESSAELTGQEIITTASEQEAIEQSLVEGNKKQAGSIIKQAINRGDVTPGPADHKKNPLPVDDETGAVGGGLFVEDGSGVYDHVNRFKGKSETQMGDIAKKDIENKWIPNGMYR
tara:strand:+ start:987 stop:2258 length:1272 start_codon:yes stop_codon:yes gene_type:complete